MNDLTHLDLFSGIGGFALAAQRAGFRTVGFSEINPYACRVLAARFPGVPNFGDVRKRKSFAGLRPLVLNGGFPCQPWSEAGERRGESDDRHLWPAMCDVIEETRPTWVIGENVPGIIGLGLEQVCLDLENRGYSAQSFIVPACAVGAWHRRDRVWVIAHFDGPRKQQQNGSLGEIRGRAGDEDSQAAADACGLRLEGRDFQKASGRSKPAILSPHDCGREFGWPAESPLVRVVHGIPHRSHRIAGLGNAIVPQVAEPFFHWIAQIERGEIT